MVHAYLDYNATAPIWPQVTAATADAMNACGNPSSVHASGRNARRLVEDAREKVAELVNTKPSQIIFTSSGTEANNMALSQVQDGLAIVSAIEHLSVLKVHEASKLVQVNPNGVIELDHLQSLLKECPQGSIISIMLANNETGVIQPVKEVSAMARDWGLLVHCDAIQATGKIDVDWGDLGIDMMSLSAHKLGGPQGIGALVLDEGLEFRPLLRGGGQELSRRAGTENVAGIVGFGVAAELAYRNRSQMDQTGRLREKLEKNLRSVVSDINIYGSSVERLPNTSCVSMPDVEAERQVMVLDLKGVMVSAGSACSSGKVTTSHVLAAMGCDHAQASTSIRVSLGWQSSEEEVDFFLTEWCELFFRTRNVDKLKATAA